MPKVRINNVQIVGKDFDVFLFRPGEGKPDNDIGVAKLHDQDSCLMATRARECTLLLILNIVPQYLSLILPFCGQSTNFLVPRSNCVSLLYILSLFLLAFKKAFCVSGHDESIYILLAQGGLNVLELLVTLLRCNFVLSVLGFCRLPAVSYKQDKSPNLSLYVWLQPLASSHL